MGKTIKVTRKLVKGYNIVVKKKGDNLFAAYSPLAYPYDFLLQKVNSVRHAIRYFNAHISNKLKDFRADIYDLNNNLLFQLKLNPSFGNSYRIEFSSSDTRKNLGEVCILEAKLEYFFGRYIQEFAKENGYKIGDIKYNFKTFEERMKERKSEKF